MTRTRGKTHDLKIWPEHFEEILAGRKRFELRRDDRPYATGDRLILREWDQDAGDFTGRGLQVWVTHMLRGGQFGLEAGWVVMSISSPEPILEEWLKRTDEPPKSA